MNIITRVNLNTYTEYEHIYYGIWTNLIIFSLAELTHNMQSEPALIYWYANSNDRECSSRMDNLTFPRNHLDRWVRQIWCALRKQYFSLNFVTMRSAWLKQRAFCDILRVFWNYIQIKLRNNRSLKKKISNKIFGNKRIFKIYCGEWESKCITKLFIL